MNDFNRLKFHISGSASEHVSNNKLRLVHVFIRKLVNEILKRRGEFVITFGNEPKQNSFPLIFDYTIMETIDEFYSKIPENNNMVTSAILYSSHKQKISKDRKELYDKFKNNKSVRIKVLPYLSSQGGKLRDEISRNSDVLITLGGLKGVFNLIEKFNRRKKIIIPLSIDLGTPASSTCINRLNEGVLNLYPDQVSEQIITQINTFCLSQDSDIQSSIEKVLDMLFLLIKGRGEEIVNFIIRDLKTLQEKNRAVKPDEDKLSLVFVEFLRRSLKPYGYFAHTQELSGKTSMGYDDQVIHGGMGELDIRIVDENNELKHICEAFILTYLDTANISKHLNKIFDYDVNGLPLNLVIIYAKATDFSSLWQKYLEFLHEFNWKYPLIDSRIADLSKERSCPAEIKITLTKHNREGAKCMIYHIFVNLC